MTRNYTYKYKLLIFLILILTISEFSAVAQKKSRIEILHSDKLTVDKKIDPELKKLIGHVELKHDSAYMYCDSSYFYSLSNRFIAYGNVLLAQGDTLFLYGDSLKYNGNTSDGRVFSNVRLMDKSMTLTTNHLYFNMKENISRYYNGGKIVDSLNVLTSNIGIYSSDSHEFTFSDNVVLDNTDYDIYSDTLKYNTEKEMAFFYGPTEIIGDSFYIYCENGWYDSFNDISQYGKNTIIKSKESILSTDSLHYERKTSIGFAYNNITLHDTLQKIILKGNYAYFNQQKEYSRITDSAQYIQYDNTDSLFLHADTLLNTNDSTGNYKIIRAWNHVKFYSFDMQGKCDSLVYSSKDSITQLYTEPVLWNNNSQLSASFIQIYSRNNKAEKIDMQSKAFIITEEDSTKFNQISGKNMTGFIKDNELSRIDVNGNAQSIYFPKDGEDIIGANKSEASNMIIYFADGKASKINLINSPKGVMKPLKQTNKDDLSLKNFIWLDNRRPKNKYDIFTW